MELTPSQQHAVTTDSTDVLCLAGAGSGKTRVLVERVVHLVKDRGMSPSNIMVLTFTRKAAGEVMERLKARMSDVYCDRPGHTPTPWTPGTMLIGTFHAVSLGIIRSHYETLGYVSDPTVVTEDDSVRLLGQVCVDLGYRVGEHYRLGLSFEQISRAVGSYYSTGRFPVFGEARQEEACKRIMAEYHGRLRELNALDFGLILIQAKKLLDEHLDIRKRWHDRIRAVLVDEIQDTDETQFDLHSRFCPPAAFFGVGDRRQSIYRFRGARPDLMTERHPQAEIIDLRENFRSGAKIVDAANRLIHHNGDMLAAPMICATGRTGGVQVVHGRSEAIARVLNAVLCRYRPGEASVMARSHRILRRLETVCRDAGLPVYRVGAAFGICESDEFQTLFAAMRLVANPRDNLAFVRLRDVLGINAYRYADIRAQAADAGCSHWAALGRSDAVNSGVGRFLVDGMVSQMKAVAFADRFCAAANIRPGPLVDFWKRFTPSLDVATAVRWFGLRDGQDDLDVGENITLLTGHAGKGLEWPVVLVAELNEGQFPSSQALKDVDGDKEERRLAYVAMTRARETLILHFREPEDQHVTKKPALVSRFIAEAMGGWARGDKNDTGMRSLRDDAGSEAVSVCDHRDRRERGAGGGPGPAGEQGPVPEGDRQGGTVCPARAGGAGEGH